MLSGIFQKRKKIQELRAPSLQDIKKFREFYGRHADKRHVETPACFERSIYKAISCQKELHSVDFRQEDVTDPQIIALAETLVEMPMISSLDLRDNRITDDGAKALLEVLRLQIITAKTPPKTDPKTKKVLPPPSVPEYTRYVTNVNLKGNEISAGVLQEMAQYTELLKREDKRLEIRAALNQIDRNSEGGIDEEDFKAVVKLLAGTEPSKKEVRQLMGKSNVSGDSFQNSVALENVLLAKCSSSPSKKAACPPWEALVQVRHAQIGGYDPVVSVPTRGFTPSRSPESHQTGQFATTNANVQVKARTQDTGGSIQTSSVQEDSTQKIPVVSSVPSVVVPPQTPIAVTQARTGSMSSLSVDDEGSGSSPRSRTDFGPPSSPPPPLPLPQTISPERRATNASAVSGSPTLRGSMDEAEGNEVTGGRRGVARSSIDASGSPFVARQGSAENPNYISPVSPSMSVASPVSRDDFSVDLASWRDDELFGDDDDANSHFDSGEKDERLVLDSKQSQDEAQSVASRVSGSSSNRPGAPMTNSGQRRNEAGSASSNFGELSDVDGDTGANRSELEHLRSLAYSDRIDQTSDTIPYSDSKQYSKGAVPEEEEEQEDEEERVDSIVIDIMKDGKPRNIAKIIHTEFKRGLLLQDFPDAVPFRNLVVLILSENGLRDLSLFKECRFPCTTVVDLSQNLLTKLSDDELACFPKLQVVDLSRNRLKVISGLGKLYDVKALNLCENTIRNVINIEHLVQLQVLRLRANTITATSALRLLSLNKMLSHLDLDDNPIVETDDRQRRKVTAHILNIVPTLSSLGSVPIAGHHSKDKRKLTNVDSMGKSLLEHDEYPDLRASWASNACDILQIVQDHEPEVVRSGDDDDDPYGDMTMGGGSSPTRQKKLSREQQRQRDELRSRAVAYRSRDKAPPSPIRQKVSPFAFGPPQPPATKKSPKKKPVKDPKLAQEQKRRSVQLSAPKHPPVDTLQLKQEQRRKSRPTFDVNMSVAERLQLVREKSSRRTSTLAPHSEVGPSQRGSVMNGESYSMMRPAHHEPALVMEIRSQNSPVRGSPQRSESIMEFRIEPLPVRSPEHHRGHIDNQTNSATSPTGKPQQPSAADTTSERKPSLKESSFLQSLAVSDFLNHAEEEISTASTALNVLLSICERTPSDLKKLSEYRISLDALDILNERESLELFQQAKHHDDPAKVRECTTEFEKLRTLKKCIQELLHKLEDHAPGSPTIRSYCGILRTNELRDIIESSADDRDETPNNEVFAPSPTQRSPEAQRTQPQQPLLPSSDAQVSDKSPVQPSPTQSLHSRLFRNEETEKAVDVAGDATESPTTAVAAATAAAPAAATLAAAPSTKADDDDEFDFLSTEKSMFDDDDDGSTKPFSDDDHPATSAELDGKLLTTEEEVTSSDDQAAEDSGEILSADKALFDTSDQYEITSCPVASPSLERSERSHSATSTDITHDIQEPEDDEDDPFDLDTELLLGDSAPVADATESSAVVEEQREDEQDIDPDFNEGEDPKSTQHVQAEIEQEEEYDWDATEPDTGVTAAQPRNEEDEEDEAEEEDDQAAYEAEDEVPQAEASPDVVAEEEEEEEVVDAEDEDDEEAETFGDWEKGFDPNTNHYFWFNHETGESQWVPPEGWPYEVDTPFEEDAEQDEVAQVNDTQDAAEKEDEEAYEEPSAVPESPPKSSFEGDDDFFSDQDLPDF